MFIAHNYSYLEYHGYSDFVIERSVFWFWMIRNELGSLGCLSMQKWVYAKMLTIWPQIHI